MKKPVVLFIGIYSPTYHSAGMVKALVSLNYDVRIINWQMYRLQNGTAALVKHVFDEALRVKPEFIFLQLQNAEVGSTCRLKELNDIAPVINFTFDIRENILWYKEIAPHIALTVFACQKDVAECRAAGIENVMHSHSSCDMDIYKRIPERVKCPEIVFIGNDLTLSNMNFPQAQQRKDMVAFMSEKFGSRFGAYGQGFADSRIIHQQEEVLIYNSCKIAITQNHFITPGYCSDRGWRAMACGALTVNHYYEGIVYDIPNGTAWDSFENLYNACDYFLDHSEQRKQFSLMNKYFVTTHHSWTNRFKDIIQALHTKKLQKDIY